MTTRASQIAKRVRTALAQDERTEDATIEVVEAHGVVTLRSEVDSPSVREAAESIARAQDDVVEVVNELVVNDDVDDEDGVGPITLNALASSGRKGYVP